MVERHLAKVDVAGSNPVSRFFIILAMKYIGEIYRPPSEAKSLILQLTVGCSHNRCTFCGVYKNKKFTIRSFEDIKKDIDEVSQYGIIPRVFLADADALSLIHI